MDIADGWMWGLVIIGGPLLIGIFMAVFANRRNKLNRVEREISEQGAHKNWGKEEIH
ncbi:hypothetical protein [Microvirga guangxiensis]|uniref:Uncharacterized protein n=1 Tax=Microvirga guangxiensis TaxID=549386 RepID=A0A1G5LEG4_9HYPH|nr:hypothetical protein [Microvirga guangxiensis]SCZ11024.1 hypothetical protein SAMN02927923_04190 [Microvirga guangxiensis]